MNRIDQIFFDLRQRQGRALMPFITAGDPDMPTTAKLLEAMQDAGAHICEIGFPFSDPVADGPVIQASMMRALERGVTVRDILNTVSEVRPRLNIGLIAMVSYSIVNRIGDAQFIRSCKEAGIDGFIFPDLPLEEAQPVLEEVREAGLIASMLIAPTTPIARAMEIARVCTGFIYLLSRSGTTGEQSSLPPQLPQLVRRIREVTDLPIAVGFGVSNASQVREVVSVADAAIVGSAIVRKMTQDATDSSDCIEAVQQFTAELASGLTSQPATS